MLIRLLPNEEEGHYHIGYIRPDDSGITSISENHTHEIMNAQNPETGQVGPVVKPVNEHTHRIQDFVGTKPPKDYDLSDEEEVIKCQQLYENAIAIDEESNSLDRAIEAEKFYSGDQWDEKIKRKLQKDKRACLTLNQIKPKCDLLQGYYARNKTDIKLFSEENGDQATADILNFRVKNVLNRNNWDSKEFGIVGEVIQVGRGVATVGALLDHRASLKIAVESRPWNMAFFGPHREPDGSDLEYAGIFSDVSKDHLQSLYPDKADEISEYLEPDLKGKTKDPVSHNDPYEMDKNKGTVPKRRGSKKTHRLIEIQYKRYREEKVALNTIHSFYFPLTNVDKEDMKHLKTITELSLISYAPYDVYLTVYAGDVLLKHEKSIISEIGIIPFYCNRVGNYWWGKVQDGKDAQLEHNKQRSSLVDIVSKAGMYGIGTSQSAFQKSTDFERFKSEKTNPGFAFLFADNFKEHVHQFEGVRFPNEIGNVAKLSEDSVYSTMGINPQMMGISDQSQESGASQVHKQKQGFLGNDYIIEHMEASKKRLGSLLIKAIQATDTPERLLRLTENQNNNTLTGPKKVSMYPQKSEQELIQLGVERGIIPTEIMQKIQQVGQVPPELKPILEQIQEGSNLELRSKLLLMLNNFELQDYDITVSESAWSPNAKFANYLLLSELFKGNPNAPMELLVKEMPGLAQETKDEIIKSILEQRQAAMQLEQQKLQTQLQNTQIAHQNDRQQTGKPSK